jgi:N-acylneuraminate cytidylyltransferase
MIDDRRVVAVVPARGGSKGVPGKNLRLVAGVSLLHRTLHTARASRYIDEVVVSSDDETILSHATHVDGVSITRRPTELATDSSAMWPVVDHVLSTTAADIVVLLQPTSPLRETADIDGALEKFVASHATSLISVSPSRTSPFWMYRLTEGDRLDPLLPKLDVLTRQELPTTFQVNGALYVVDSSWFSTTHTFVDDATIAYVMPAERSIDVDTPEDLFVAEALLALRESPSPSNDK